MSDSSRPHGLQPTRLLCPWDFPSKSTGVGCHCLLRHKGLGVGNSTEVWSQRAGVKDFRQKSMKIVFLSSLQLWTTMTLFHWRFLKEHVKYPEKLSLPRMNARISLHQLLPLLECVCVCVCACVYVCTMTEEAWKIDLLLSSGWSPPHFLKPVTNGVELRGILYHFPTVLFFLIFIYWSIVALCVSFCLQQSESVIHMSPLFWISFSFRSPQSIE